MYVIDPMHNLFLGSAKTLFKLWKDSKLLSKPNIIDIENRVANMKATSDLGMLPSNITIPVLVVQEASYEFIFFVGCLQLWRA